MRKDNILSVEIDELGRLLIKPETERFTQIYRTSSEVHWDQKKCVLYSPKPREWNYFDWYKHILKIADEQCSCKLYLTSNTEWINIPDDLRDQIKFYDT